MVCFFLLLFPSSVLKNIQDFRPWPVKRMAICLVVLYNSMVLNNDLFSAITLLFYVIYPKVSCLLTFDPLLDLSTLINYNTIKMVGNLAVVYLFTVNCCKMCEITVVDKAQQHLKLLNAIKLVSP